MINNEWLVSNLQMKMHKNWRKREREKKKERKKEKGLRDIYIN